MAYDTGRWLFGGCIQSISSVFGGFHLLLVADGLRPTGPKDSSKAGVDECLDLLQCRNRGSPYFSSMQQDSLYSGVKDSDFDVDGQLR